jgi:hypothetical protein
MSGPDDTVPNYQTQSLVKRRGEFPHGPTNSQRPDLIGFQAQSLVKRRGEFPHGPSNSQRLD